jgi:hypothetical protein
MAKRQFIPNIRNSSQGELLKVHSVNIEGPMEEINGEHYFKVSLEQADIDEVIRMSNHVTRHFFDSTHPLIFKKAEQCMEENKVLKLAVYPTIMELNATKNTRYEIEGHKWIDKDPYFKTLIFGDENPRNVLVAETVMQELHFVAIKQPKP